MLMLGMKAVQVIESALNLAFLVFGGNSTDTGKWRGRIMR
jgi:hypothetical protein